MKDKTIKSTELLTLSTLVSLGTLGLSYIITQHSGPFDIFDRLRSVTPCPHLLDTDQVAKEVDLENLLKDYDMCCEDNSFVFEICTNINNIFSCVFCVSPYVATFLSLCAKFANSKRLSYWYVPILVFVGVAANAKGAVWLQD